MNIKRKRLVSVLSAALLLSAGCSSTPTMEETTPADQLMGDETFAMTPGEVLAMYGDGQMLTEQEKLAVEKAAMAERRVFYFDFDSSTILPEDRDLLRLHALYLSTHPTASAELTGHTDERGTREYNMALGERRSRAVEGYLVIHGTANGQMEVLSFGEEYPAMPGETDAAYAKNRRVELDYR